MKLAATSGDADLDRAAWDSITASNSLPPLPTEFPGQFVALRFTFFYNPDKIDLATAAGESPRGASSKSGITVSIPGPSSVHVTVGGSYVFSPTVKGTTDTIVKWTIVGSGCASSDCGAMQEGLYLAPSSLPSPPAVTLTATSKADPTASASVTVNLVAAKNAD
jgi:hypothetical protein